MCVCAGVCVCVYIYKGGVSACLLVFVTSKQLHVHIYVRSVRMHVSCPYGHVSSNFANNIAAGTHVFTIAVTATAVLSPVTGIIRFHHLPTTLFQINS